MYASVHGVVVPTGKNSPLCNELKTAAYNFHASNKIGQRGFETVYKQTIHAILGKKTFRLFTLFDLIYFVLSSLSYGEKTMHDITWVLCFNHSNVAFFCTHAAPNQRPMMSQAVKMLPRVVYLSKKQFIVPVLNSNKSSTAYRMNPSVTIELQILAEKSKLTNLFP
ncbi:hypothetical protein NMG60_11016656 [Bertholletia excelsa]